MFGVAVVLVLPALALLYMLTQRSMLVETREPEQAGRVSVRGPQST